MDRINNAISSAINYTQKSAFIPFVLGVLLWIIDINQGFAGFTIDSYKNFLKLIPNVLISVLFISLAILVYFILASGFKIPPRKVLLIVLAGFFTFTILLYGGRSTFLHIIFVLLIVAFTQDGSPIEEKAMWYLGIILIDFVFLSLINFNGLILSEGILYYLIPTPLIYAISRGLSYESSSILKFIYTFLIIFIIFILVFNAWDKWRMYNEMETLAPGALKSDVKSAWEKAWENMKSFGTEIKKAITEPFNTSYYDYSGDQEKTQNPQGVYIQEIEKGDMLFFEETPTLLWAILEARTLEKQIDAVKVTCTTELEDGTIAKGIVNEGTTIYTFPVYSGVDRPLSCRFDNLIKGDYEAKFEAEFDFTTETRQLVYLMDRTRYTEELIALKRQGSATTSDAILRSVDITVTNPASIYTSGPIAAKIGTNNFPWDIGDANNILYRFGVEIKNEWTKGGEIKSINKVSFIMPSTFSIVKNSCGIGMNYDSPKIVNGEKIYETTDIITDAQDERTVNCLIRVDKSSLDRSVEVTRRYLKTAVDYTFIMEKKIDFEVEKLHDEIDQEIIDSDSVCCKIGSSYSLLSKTDCSSKGTQAAVNKCYEECCEIKETGKSNTYLWVSSQSMCDEYDSSTKSGAIISDKAKCPPK